MSYDVPTKKYPIGADVNAVATFLAQRQSDSGTTNGGIVATDDTPVPQLGADASGLSLAYMKGMADALMCGVGFQGQSDAAASTGSTSSTSYVDVSGYSSYSFTAQIAKTYLVTVVCTAFASVASGGNAVARFRLLNNADTYLPVNGFMQFPQVNIHERLVFQIPVAMVAGTNTLKLQWLSDDGADTINTNSNNMRCFTVQG